MTGRRKAITITRVRRGSMAECEQCGTVNEWTRERARQHADQQRHTVHFLIEDSTTYTPSEEPS